MMNTAHLKGGDRAGTMPCRSGTAAGSWNGKIFAWLPAALMLLAPVTGSSAIAEQAPKPLRLCADPANLPFSSDDPHRPGLYLEIGQAIGRVMGREVVSVWNLTYFGKRAVRTTVLAGKCDAEIGLPQDPGFMGPKLIFSKPLLRVGYALIVPISSAAVSLDDLKGSRVAVQLGTTPQNLLTQREDIQTATFREPEQAMRGLAAGQADAAFIWGPVAGFLNKTEFADTYRIVPVDGLGLQWPAAIGFAKGQDDLRDEVDRAIDSVADEIAALETKYGLPAKTSTETKRAEAVAPTVLRVAASGQSGGTTQTAVLSESPEQTAARSAENAADVAAGRELFDGTCAHCHGPGAVTAERRINLRLLHRRYGDKMDETFLYTVTHGRPEKGMPNWTGGFSEEQFAQILAFLHTVQTP